MSEDVISLIDYDTEVQNALRGVVKSVLTSAANEGLPGDHHFYIAFDTTAPGVLMPPYLLSRFPEEMTVVVQHEYWGLKVCADYFEIGLNFNQKPELLTIPFDAIVGFVDPSVQFALQFHGGEDGIDGDTVVDEDFELDLSEDISSIKESIKEDVSSDDSKADAASEKGGDNVVSLDFNRKK